MSLLGRQNREGAPGSDSEASGSVASSYLSRASKALQTIDSRELEVALNLLLSAHWDRRRVYVMGNGGSAATAGHFVCDLAKTVGEGRGPGLRVHALTDSVASLTAWANDTSYDRVFAAQIENYVEGGDVAIAISASGNSPNIVAGLQQASIQGASTIAMVGFDGGDAAELGDVVLHARDDDYGCVEDVHSAIGHALTAGLRHALRSAAGAAR